MGGSSFKLIRQNVVMSLLESHQADHIAAALIGRHGLEQVRPSVKNSYARGTKQLVARKRVKVAPKLLHIDLEVGHGLRSVDKNRHTSLVRQFRHFPNRHDGSKRIGNMGHGDELGFLVEQTPILSQN